MALELGLHRVVLDKSKHVPQVSASPLSKGTMGLNPLGAR